MAQTVNAIIIGGLKSFNVKGGGESLSAEEAADGLIALNDVIDMMNLQPLMHPAKAQITQALTSNDGTYTFGSGGDNSVRPLEIHTAYVRKSNTDYPVDIISNQRYSYITFKSVAGGFSYNLYYRNAYPLSTIELYPIPSSSGQTLYLECRAELANYTAVTDNVDLAPGYIKYIKNQLAIDISPEYKANISPVIYETAKEAKAWIKRNNSKDKPFMQNTARQAVRSRDGYGGYLFGGVS